MSLQPISQFNGDDGSTWQGWDAWPRGTVCVMRRSYNLPLVLAVDDISPEFWPGAFCTIWPTDSEEKTS